MARLTEKQKRFADYYIETGNASDSYRKAYNCTEKTASVEGFKNLAKPSVKTYIDTRMKELADKRIMSQREALELLTSIARAEITEELYIPTETGVERIEKIPDIRDRQKALEALLKRYPANEFEELKNEQLKHQISKLKAEVDKLNNGDDDKPIEVVIKRKEK